MCGPKKEETERRGRVVIILDSVWDVAGLNHGSETNCTEIFMVFLI
jgi:hypothetical protein